MSAVNQVLPPAPVSKILRGPKSFDPSTYLKPGCTLEEILELKEAFDLIDLDSSGSIELQEFKKMITDFGLEAKNSAIFELISEIDSDNSGKIEFPEFLSLITGDSSNENSKVEIQKVFNIFDKEKTGFISFKDLRELVDDIGLQLSDATLKRLIEKGDSDSDKLVTFDDFYFIMTRKVV
jgi:Ca2+-binding EF-hand superfamily protein